MSITPLWAGFECGHLGWCDQDLLIESRHTPDTDMVVHYEDMLRKGVTTARDGLPWRHDPIKRVAAVPEGVRVIWDLCHYDPPKDPIGHVSRCALAFSEAPHIIANNEPWIWPMLVGRSREEASYLSIMMMDRMAAYWPDATFYTADPFHHLAEDAFQTTDAIVASGRISVVGINYYPHHAHAPLREVIEAVADRYRMPVALTETGFHDGHPENHRAFGVHDRHGWLAHVRQEVARSGREVVGICGYPWLDTPAWGCPGTSERWPSGMSIAA